MIRFVVAVVVVIGVFLVGYPILFKQRRMAQDAQTQLVCAAAAASEFYRAHGDWPQSLEEIAARDPTGNIRGVGTNLLDVWKHRLIFERYEMNRGYGRVVSLGRDGMMGGSGLDRDLFYPFAEDQGRNVELARKLARQR